MMQIIYCNSKDDWKNLAWISR